MKSRGKKLNGGFSAYVGEEEGLRYQLVAGGIVAVVVVLAAVIVLTVVFVRSRSNDECNKKQPSDCDTLEYRNGEGEQRYGVELDLFLYCLTHCYPIL